MQQQKPRGFCFQDAWTVKKLLKLTHVFTALYIKIILETLFKYLINNCKLTTQPVATKDKDRMQ